MKSFGLVFVQLFLICCFVTSVRILPHRDGEALSSATFENYLHFKNTSKRQFPVPEFFPTSDVLITDLVVHDYKRFDFISALLNANANVQILTGDDPGQRETLEKDLAENFTPAELGRIKLIAANFSTPWLRDFGPLPIMQRPLHRPSFRLGFVDFLYDRDAPADDGVVKTLADTLMVKRRQAAFINHGGNFLTNGELCFMGELPGGNFSAAFPDPISPDLAEEFVVKFYREVVGCDDVIIFKDPPHAHIDMWAKVVSRDTVLVSEIDQKTLDLFSIGDNVIPYELEEIKRQLDERAAEFAKYLKVIRIPMPAPYRGVFRNYTNALMVNDTAIVPSYQKFGWNYETYPDSSLTSFYETKAKETYEKFGMKVRMINADALMFNGGAFHCLAQQILLTDIN